ncbi:hypothetical protein [Synechococcus sp. CCY 9618]|uniref:hypothetical protein n=1 Tax=Synechococcus sp. CCY 9618 TaxID=2815602 RepID=UPI001C21BDA1|nr:hypothetical protein [Synechococcus sp. CCY 9618]
MTSRLKAALAIPFMIGLAAAPALAGSATNEAVNEQLALERTLSDVPDSAVVTRKDCTSFGPETHFRCHVEWSDPTN